MIRCQSCLKWGGDVGDTKNEPMKILHLQNSNDYELNINYIDAHVWECYYGFLLCLVKCNWEGY